MTGSSTTEADAAIVIAKSDIIILTVSSLALALGVARWQMGTRYVETITIPASARISQPVPVIEPGLPAANAGNATSAAVVASPERPAPTTTIAPRNIEAPTRQVTLPAPEPVPGIDATTAVANAAAPEAAYGIHRVRSGQSLSKLAVQYGTTVDTLQQLNGISGTTIFIGQELRYPLPSP